MPQQVHGVIARSKGAPVELVDVVVPDPGPGEAVVAVAARGVCHTDLTYREGGINDKFPFLLGHEAAGTVESIGEGVTHVAVGDFVVLNWRAVCGDCRACRRGEPWYCFDTHNAAQRMTLTDGTELTPALGIGAFADKTLVHEGQCTKVNPSADPAVVGLLGCGVMAGIGAAMNTGGVGRGDSVASSDAAGSATPPLRGRASPGPPRSSPSTGTRRSWSGRGSSAPCWTGRSSDGRAAGRPRRHLGHVLPRRGHLGGRQQRLAAR